MVSHFRPLGYLPPKVAFTERADGSVLMSCPYPMLPPPPHVLAPLVRWAKEIPDHIWLAERDESGGWRRLSYGQAKETVCSIASALLSRGWGPHSTLMILSENSIEHALISYGAMLAGAPVAPISVSHSLMSGDFAKLRHVFDTVRPAAIFVQDGRQFQNALAALDLSRCEIIYKNRPPLLEARLTQYSDLLNTASGIAVADSLAQLNPTMTARYMFTSGSTGLPKAVIVTHGNMGANAVMMRSLLETAPQEPPVYLSWLPWNHIFGANTILNTALAEGGTLYIDKGRPLPGEFAETVKNLREIAPTHYTNVPSGFAMLAPELERDLKFARHFFSRLKGLRYGGAAMGKELAQRLQTIALRACGEHIGMQTGYGATETGPTITAVYWETGDVGLLGLPLPGAELKLVPVSGKYEVRTRGISVTPGYLGRPDLTEAAFDDEGFYRLGDGARFVDPQNSEKGLLFDGRVVEDFKLSTGTWVNAGPLRVKALDSCDGLLSDALIAGENCDFLALLGFPDIERCRGFLGVSLGCNDLIRNGKLQTHIAARLACHNRRYPASSTAIRRALLMAEPPSAEAGEITDKGYINQRATLARRRELVEKLYRNPPGNDIIIVE
jgi:feruloyl-CoA synthase